MSEFLPFAPSKVTLQKLRAQAVSRSPFTFKTQVIAAPAGAAWAAELAFSALTTEQAAIMRGFMARRNGMEVPFLFGDPGHPLPRGTARGDGFAVSGNKGASIVDFSGPGSLLEGDYFSCNQRLYVVAERINAARLRIWPALRDEGGAIEVEPAAGLFRLSGSNDSEEITPVAQSAFSLSCVEAL